MRTSYSIKNSITSFINNIISFVFLFIGQTLFIKILGVEYTGLNGLFSNILTILNLCELGIGNAITFHLYKYTKSNDIDTTKAIMKFFRKSYNIISLVVLVVGTLIIPFLSFIIKDLSIDINIYYVYVLFLFSTVFTYVMSYKRNLLFSYQRSYIINIVHIVMIILLNIFQILILYLTKNYYLYLILKIIFVILENIVICIITNKFYPYIKDKDVKPLDISIRNDIIRRVKALFIHKTSGAVTNGTDNIIISSFLGITFVGLYSNYYYIIHAIYNLFSTIIKSTTSSVGNLLVDNNYRKNYEVFRKIFFLNYVIGCFTSVSLFVLIEPFVKIWLGNKFILDKLVLVVLIINFFQTFMRSTFITFKDSAGIWVEDRFVPLVQLSLNIIFSILLLKIFGLSGVFMGTIISSLSLWCYSYPKFIYKGLLNKNYKDYILNVINYILLFIFILLLTYYISSFISIDNVILELVLKGIICLLIPSIIMYLLFKSSNEFLYYKQLLLNLIKTKIVRKKN